MDEYLEIEQNGKKVHVSVGAIIVNDKGEILMMDRTNRPLGWAGPAGHMDVEDESPESALAREVMEETGIEIKDKVKFKIAEEFLPWNVCSSGMRGHYWHLYIIQVHSGYFRRNSESREIKWVSRDELKHLKLEEAFEYWFKKLRWI